MDERIPSAKDLYELTGDLQRLVIMTGPNAPPGRERADGAGEVWPESLDVAVAEAAFAAVHILSSDALCPLDEPPLVARGWPVEVEIALNAALSALREALARWELLDAIDQEEVPLPDDPLTIAEDLHDELSWAFGILARVLDDKGVIGREEDERTNGDLSVSLRRWRPRAKRQAIFLRFMEDRRTASYEEIAQEVYDGDPGQENAIEKLVGRVNESLVRMRKPLRFRYGSRYVFKDEIPE